MGKSETEAGRRLVEYFDAIRVISLVHRTDRRREMEGQFAKLGMTVDGEKLAFFDARKFQDADGFPTPGTRGCFQSHIDILTEAKAKNWKNVLIFEDDLDFHDEINVLLTNALDALEQTEWDLFFGSVISGHYEAVDTPIERLSPEARLFGTHFYAMNGKAIAKSLDYLAAMMDRPSGGGHFHGEKMHYDGALSVLRRRNPDLVTYLANPDLGFQRLSRTDVHQLATYDRLPVIRNLAAASRHIVKSLGFSQQILRKR